MLKKTTYHVLLLVVLLTASCNTGRPAQSPAPSVQLSERLDKIKMTDLKGRPLTLHTLTGKPVFLNFWATWCGPCVSEMRSIEAVYQQFKNDIVFLAVSNEEPAKIRSFLDRHQFSFEFARLEIAYIDAYIVTMPTTMLIDAGGNLIAEEEGFREWTQFNNLEKLKALAKGK